MLITIIIPIYNSEKYIEKCLESCFKQTLTDIEVICVNNGSKDNSYNILKKYEDHITLLNLSKPSIGNARNEGLKYANGEYIFFLDSDDYLKNDSMEKMYNYAKKNNLDMVITDYFRDNNDQKSYVNTFSFNIVEHDYILNNLVMFNYGPSKLFKKSLITNNNIEFPIDVKYEDVPFVLNCLVKANKIGKINEALFFYLVHDNSETTTRDIKMLDIFKIINQCQNICDKKYLENLFVKIITNYNIQQRYQKNRKLRIKFISTSFDYLNQNYNNWKKCNYLKERKYPKRIIERNKILTIFYCDIYNLFH